MSFLVLKAYLKLIQFDFHLARGNFNALYEEVKKCAVRQPPAPANAVEHVCAAVDVACIWYWKEVFCLQRSAATAWLLKQHGVPAEMIFGAQRLPFRAHAWVEVQGHVVNDKPYMREKYQVLDRC